MKTIDFISTFSSGCQVSRDTPADVFCGGLFRAFGVDEPCGAAHLLPHVDLCEVAATVAVDP